MIQYVINAATGETSKTQESRLKKDKSNSPIVEESLGLIIGSLGHTRGSPTASLPFRSLEYLTRINTPRHQTAPSKDVLKEDTIDDRNYSGDSPLSVTSSSSSGTPSFCVSVASIVRTPQTPNCGDVNEDPCFLSPLMVATSSNPDVDDSDLHTLFINAKDSIELDRYDKSKREETTLETTTHLQQSSMMFDNNSNNSSPSSTLDDIVIPIGSEYINQGRGECFEHMNEGGDEEGEREDEYNQGNHIQIASPLPLPKFHTKNATVSFTVGPHEQENLPVSVPSPIRNRRPSVSFSISDAYPSSIATPVMMTRQTSNKAIVEVEENDHDNGNLHDNDNDNESSGEKDKNYMRLPQQFDELLKSSVLSPPSTACIDSIQLHSSPLMKPSGTRLLPRISFKLTLCVSTVFFVFLIWVLEKYSPGNKILHSLGTIDKKIPNTHHVHHVHHVHDGVHVMKLQDDTDTSSSIHFIPKTSTNNIVHPKAEYRQYNNELYNTGSYNVGLYNSASLQLDCKIKPVWRIKNGPALPPPTTFLHDDKVELFQRRNDDGYARELQIPKILRTMRQTIKMFIHTFKRVVGRVKQYFYMKKNILFLKY